MTPDPKLPIEDRPPQAVSARAETTTALLDPPPPAATPQPQPAVQLWLHRTSVFLFVLISAIAGVLLVILPFSPLWGPGQDHEQDAGDGPQSGLITISCSRSPGSAPLLQPGSFVASAAAWVYSISGSASGKPSITTNTNSTDNFGQPIAKGIPLRTFYFTTLRFRTSHFRT